MGLRLEDTRAEDEREERGGGAAEARVYVQVLNTAAVSARARLRRPLVFARARALSVSHASRATGPGGSLVRMRRTEAYGTTAK